MSVPKWLAARLSAAADAREAVANSPGVVANEPPVVANTAPKVANSPQCLVANTRNAARSTRHGKYADADKRRAYMRELMRAKRAKS
jgi:hypothetical protein